MRTSHLISGSEAVAADSVSSAVRGLGPARSFASGPGWSRGGGESCAIAANRVVADASVSSAGAFCLASSVASQFRCVTPKAVLQASVVTARRGHACRRSLRISERFGA